LTGAVYHSVSIDKSKVAALIENTRIIAAIQVRQREIAAQEAEAERLRAERAEIARQARERQRQQAAIELQQREVEYTRWRRTLTVGSSTFCGFVIERNGPMVKIAVNTLLPGYPSEQWLKIDAVYPAHLGCRNRNGVLSTATDP